MLGETDLNLSKDPRRRIEERARVDNKLPHAQKAYAEAKRKERREVTQTTVKRELDSDNERATASVKAIRRAMDSDDEEKEPEMERPKVWDDKPGSTEFSISLRLKKEPGNGCAEAPRTPPRVTSLASSATDALFVVKEEAKEEVKLEQGIKKECKQEAEWGDAGDDIKPVSRPLSKPRQELYRLCCTLLDLSYGAATVPVALVAKQMNTWGPHLQMLVEDSTPLKEHIHLVWEAHPGQQPSIRIVR